MRVVGVRDVEQNAGGELRVTVGDVVTPLARDRARELNVRFIVTPNSGASPDYIGTPGAAFEEPAPNGRQATNDPPAGALYRRGAPVVNADQDPRSVVSGAHRGPGGRLTVVGAGHVGVTTAMRLAESDLFGEIVMVDTVPGLAEGLALDLTHSAGLQRFGTTLRGTNDPADAAGADYVVVTAGRPRQPGMSRSDLIRVNAEIISAVSTDIGRHSPDATVLVVTNPLDEMTALAQRETGFGPERVLGMAGVLDAARFCALVALATGGRAEEVSALALGSHGNEMVIPLSQARVGGRRIASVLDEATLERIVERTRDSGAEVVGLLKTGSAYYAPAASVARMIGAMVQGSDEVLGACVQADGTFGISGTYLGLPVRLDSGGVAEIVSLDLSAAELSELRVAAQRIEERFSELAGA
ncbi:MAG: malate dehydrogenase [bacterium]|nr:malate dehydrogenase [bacterium]MCY3953973.1 malate dehydrogenase [bacterium]